MDTIFALASARGKSGVAVIRASGPRVEDIALHLNFSLPPERQVGLRKLVSNGIILDEALVCYFSGPRSFTGEDVLELYPHGSVATVSAILRTFGEMEGFRQAEPGEFTRRALENERLDLSQVEGLADLIDAETEAQRRQALKILSGELGERAEVWRRDLIRAAALLEATIDFADEDVPIDVTPEVKELVSRTMSDLRRDIAGYSAAERIREGFEIAIVGRPNVGKSSLLNALAGREAAITSEIAGTTRDVIEVRMDINGLAVTFVDTAGLREATDQVESLGIELAKRRSERADLRLVLLENASDKPPIPTDAEDIVLVSKADLGVGDISAKTGSGILELTGNIGKILENRISGAGLAVRERHRVAMEQAIEYLANASELLADGLASSEVVSEELRAAIRSLDSLVGRVDIEHILGEIFSSFCIGK